MTTQTPAADSPPTPFTFEVSDQRAEMWADLQMSTASLERLESLGTHDDSALCRVVELDGELRSHITERGSAEGLQSFLAEARDFTEALDRYSIINLIELISGSRRDAGERNRLPIIAWPGWTDPEDPHRCKRILTDIEMATVRYAALHKSVCHVTLVATGEGGGTIDETAALTIDHFDHDRFEIMLMGGSRTKSRTASIPSWARPGVRKLLEGTAAAIADAHGKIDGSALPILYGGKKTELRDIQKAVSMTSRNLFNAAGIGGSSSTVSFESLRRTAARRLYDANAGIEQVAAFLGERSYDTAMIKIGVAPAPAPYRRTKSSS